MAVAQQSAPQIGTHGLKLPQTGGFILPHAHIGAPFALWTTPRKQNHRRQQFIRTGIGRSKAGARGSEDSKVEELEFGARNTSPFPLPLFGVLFMFFFGGVFFFFCCFFFSVCLPLSFIYLYRVVYVQLGLSL